ncbi:MAG: adenine deaminase [Bacteroidales bacterium]|nr:adenine deaminase [Candidatus Colicola caccequi]MCQ2327874.1 adenine deaminase [Paludibacteraceae bacterium]
MRKELFNEMMRMTIISMVIYAVLFLTLWLVEFAHPGLKGVLLQWNNLAFIVGIPASVLGTAYVLTIRNPRNYFGFYEGFIMSVLLSWQFYLQGNYDLVILYLCIFLPFQIKSLVGWRRDTLKAQDDGGAFSPKFLGQKGAVWTQIIAILIVVIDYVLATKLINKDGWSDNVALKVAAACTIASSFLANFWMIYKKNDAWVCWVFYSIASIIMFVMIGNVFSIVLFVVMLLVNMNAQFAWIKSTDLDDFGWAGSREQIEQLLEQRNKMLLLRDGSREVVLKRQEQWLLRQLEQNRARQEDLLTTKNAIEVKFGHIVDVVNRRIFDGEIEIQNGKIKRITEAVVPESATYILPGFIDSHIHIESTLVLPEYYARLAVEQGTIGVITDPHEIANVLGVEGVDYMINSGKKVNFHFHFAAPSCVPATPFETSGAKLSVREVKELLKREEVYGLGEMMNVPGVLNKDPEVMQKIEETLACGKLVDGHAPNLTGEALQQYFRSGITTDHECTTLEGARERVQMGMMVQIREGSAACDFDALAPIISEAPDKVMFCSDDKYPDEIGKGYINEMCRRAVQRGIDVMDVLTAACVNPVRHYGLNHGLLQVGDNADFITVDNLREFNLSETYINGKQVVADGIYTNKLLIDKTPMDTNYPNHFLADPITEADIHVEPQEGKLKVIGSTEGSLLTKLVLADAKVENGNVVSDTKNDVLKVVCLSRHSKQKPAVGFIQGFGLKQGALASTIGHDSHNIIALGATDKDIVEAINKVIELKGGLVVSDGRELVELMLPVAGLMSYRDGDKVARRHQQLKNIAARIGCKYKAPFMTLAFMSLSVIPDIKLTDKGLFDGNKFDFTDLWQK